MSPRVAIPRDRVVAFCQKHGIRKFALFGSVLRDDFGPQSDVDVVAEFRPEIRFTLCEMGHMEDELSEILGRRVDLMEFQGLRPWFLETVLESMEVIYESPR